MAGNVIYRGPVANEPQTVNQLVAGAYSPGILCTSNGTTLTVATASDMGERVFVLSNRRFYDQDVTTAYASGDTGVAYEPKPGEVYQVRLANATYAKGDKLTLTASGYLAKAVDSPAGDVVYAYYDDTAGAVTAGALNDVVWANAFTMPTS